MSTHNIGFYEDLTKNIFELSSNIMKYAPYYHQISSNTHLIIIKYHQMRTLFLLLDKGYNVGGYFEIAFDFAWLLVCVT